jgi:hypothetical protein
VTLVDHAPANVGGVHSLGKVRVWTVDKSSLYLSAKDTIDHLFAWMQEVLQWRCPVGSVGPEGVVLVRGLQSLVRTSGSMVSLLRLVQELVQRGGEPLEAASPLWRTSSGLVAQVLQLADGEHRARCGPGTQVATTTGTTFGELPGVWTVGWQGVDCRGGVGMG